MSGSPDRPFEYSPDLLAMTVNLNGEHRVVRLDRLSGKREIVGVAQDPDKAFEEARRLTGEAHDAFIAGLKINPTASQPAVAFYAYRPDGSSINSVSQPTSVQHHDKLATA